MGKPIVYCGACGFVLLERDFHRGLAHTVDRRHFCIQCRPLSSPTLPVRGFRPLDLPSPQARSA